VPDSPISDDERRLGRAVVEGKGVTHRLMEGTGLGGGERERSLGLEANGAPWCTRLSSGIGAEIPGRHCYPRTQPKHAWWTHLNSGSCRAALVLSEAHQASLDDRLD
jgi:hypothetical protein